MNETTNRLNHFNFLLFLKENGKQMCQLGICNFEKETVIPSME